MEQILATLGFDFPEENKFFYQMLILLHLLYSLFIILRSSFSPLPYGRYDKTVIKFNAQISWFIMESPAVFVSLYVIWTHGPNLTYFSSNVFFIIPFLLHYFHRAFIYPMKLSTSSMPLTGMFFGFFYVGLNGYLQSSFILSLANVQFSSLALIRYVFGMCIFIVGMYINIHADYYLIELSKNKKHKGQYFIPKGFTFEYISCPNFFGESLEWLGYAIATWTICGWVFFLQTAVTILPRGYHHHKFYLQKFEDYPRQRKAVIPFIL